MNPRYNKTRFKSGFHIIGMTRFELATPTTPRLVKTLIRLIYQGFSRLLELVYQNYTSHHAPNICAAVRANSGKAGETIASLPR